MDLRSLCDRLLDPRATERQLREGVVALADLAKEVSGFDPDHATDDEIADQVLPSGVAISPRDAASCLTDVPRSVAYWRAIDAAIQELRERFGTVEIVYAGCGPYAALILPSLARYGPEAIRVTLVESQERSLQSALRLVETLGLGPVVPRCQDAASYRHDAGVHLVVVEAMQQALSKEPQVSITTNLAPQLVEGGRLIPERITVDLCAETFEAAVASGEPEFVIGRVAELSLTAPGRPSPARFVVPPMPPRLATLRTEIHVGFGNKMRGFDTGLTCPKVLLDLGTLQGGAVLDVSYALSPPVGFVVKRCR